MNFDIILHGKPNAGSHKVTKGLDDAFCQNLVDKFFQSMGSIRESETLIVDIRNWKSKWYSIYTFWLGNHITDTADRTSFFAISMVVPGQYVCLVSAVYTLLRDACQEYVIGTYISKNGRYIVQDFSDNAAFENLYSFLNRNFVNLSENLDDSFKPISEDASKNYYNLLDCDSLAFVEDLKKYGRVYVSKTYDSKDIRLTKTDEFFRELQIANAQLAAKGTQITQLSEKVKALEDQINSKKSSAVKAVEALKQQLDTLQKEKNVLSENISKYKTVIEKYKKKEQEIQNLLGVNIVKQSVVEKAPVKVKTTNKKKNIIPIVNTLLLVLILVVSCFKSCGLDVSDLPSNPKADSLKNQKYAVGSKGSVNVDDRDEDCGLVFLQYAPVNRNVIDVKMPLTIKVTKKHEGYEFYTDNLVGNIKSGMPFILQKLDKSKPIIITYRSANIKKCNDANKLIVK